MAKKKLDIVKLDDEHQQPIVLVKSKGTWSWYFQYGDNEDGGGEFTTRAGAIADAQAYVDQGAP